jgi:hypothetical protein
MSAYTVNGNIDYDIIAAIDPSTHANCVASIAGCPSNYKLCGKFCIPKTYSCGAESFITLGDTVSSNSPYEFSNYSPL